MTGVPNREQLNQHVVNRDGWEGIRQSLYDSLPYPIAGATSLSFFSNPIGQGTTVQGVGIAGTAAKSLSDTNMTLSGQLPANQEFLVQSIEVLFFPSTLHVTAAAQLPARLTSTTAAQVAPVLVNDEWIFRKSGNLQFVIGSKPYLQEAPLQRFPGKTQFGVTGAMTAALGATIAEPVYWQAIYPQTTGRPYMLHPASLLLTSNQNFNVSLNWPEGLQAVTNVGKTVVVLDGILYRRSQ